MTYEVEIFDMDGRPRPGLLPKLMPVFPDVLQLVARQGETHNVALGLKQYWLCPVGAPTTIFERMECDHD